MAEDKSELRPEDKVKSRSVVKETKIPQLQFRVYSSFKGVADRTKEENDRFSGRFFQFSSFGSNFDVRILDNDLWIRPPKVDQGVWVVGKLTTNSRLRITLDAKTILTPNDENPAPSLEELSEGAYWAGVGKIVKSSYVDSAGNDNFMLRVMSDGFLYSYRIGADFYDVLPDQTIARLSGVVRPTDQYFSEYQGRRVGYEFEILQWKPVK